MKNRDIVDNLSTPSVDGPVIFSIYVYIVEKLSTEIVEKIMSAEKIVESGEKLSPLFVENL